MLKTDQPWLNELGLTDQIFKDIPEGENPLAWAFKSGSLKETAYTLWASNFYKHPAIKDEFFSLAFDVSLIEKFSKLYTWNETCYPVYHWENTLFIACLEPIKISSDQNVCFVISSYSAMVTAWNKCSGKTSQPILVSPAKTTDFKFETKEQENGPEINLDFSSFETEIKHSIPAQKDLNSSQMQSSQDLNDDNKTILIHDSLPPVPKGLTKEESKVNMDSLESLDFTSLSSLNEPEIKTMNPTNDDLEKQTQTASDILFNSQTSATSMSSVKNEMDHLPLPDMSFAKKEFKIDAKNESAQFDSKENSAESSEFSSTDSESWTEEKQNELSTNDDYTPLPFLTKKEQDKNNKTNIKVSEQTLTDHARPAHIPPKHLISEEDLTKNTKLNPDHGRKGIIAHIFHHLKRDYKDLMWAELIEEGQYYPQYCYGSWDLKDQSWQTPINIVQTNIFKIAYATSLPFHGPISDNHFNDQYIEQWLRSQKPDVASIFPVCYEEYCYGFIVGFSKGPEFDENKSLKKIENLVSICKNQFLSLQSKKAA